MSRPPWASHRNSEFTTIVLGSQRTMTHASSFRRGGSPPAGIGRIVLTTGSDSKKTPPLGLEPRIFCLGNKCVVQLRYRGTSMHTCRGFA